MEIFLRQVTPLAWMLPLFVFNVLAFWLILSRWRWLNFGAAILCGLFCAFIGLVVYGTWQSGCYSEPKEVEFQQGMTLCPGQSARINMKLPMLAADPRP